MVEFGDGFSIDIQGQLAVTRNGDDWYVTGDGIMYPVENEEEGIQLLQHIEAHGMYITMKLFKSSKHRQRFAEAFGLTAAPEA